jgi:hypothetical protein
MQSAAADGGDFPACSNHSILTRTFLDHNFLFADGMDEESNLLT